MKKYFTVLFLVLLVVTSCSKDELEEERKYQTLFIYMPWSTNLTEDFENNLSDIETAIVEDNILKNTRILVFFTTSLSEATMFEMKYENGSTSRETLREYTNPGNTTVAGVTAILNDVKSYAPAEKYAMVVSCHGMAWIPKSTDSRSIQEIKLRRQAEGALLTRYFGGTTTDSQIDVTDFADGIKNANMKFEYILFDDCYMASVEVAYDLKEVTDYLIASPTEVLALGFPYQLIGKYMVGEVDYTGICEGFYSFFSSYTRMPCGTISVTKISELDDLVAIMKEINQQFTFDTSLLSSIQRMDGYTPVIFFDYGDYVAKLCTDPDLLERFNNQLEQTVPVKRNTPTYYSMTGGQIQINTFSGVIVSDPSTNSLAVQKTETAWYKATH